MQKVAAYLLEHDHSAGTPEERSTEVKQLEQLLRDWLRRKRADDPDANSGEFKSESQDATGHFEWQRAIYDNRSWRMLRLLEDYADGRRFETSVSITDTRNSIAVYVTLASGLARSAIAPVSFDARCPRILRDILHTHTEWRHGATRIRQPFRVEGNSAGKALAQEIQAHSRTLPLIVISEEDGEIVFPDLEHCLGRNLAGLANIAVVDDDASWGLTEVLGRNLSCFWQAIRIYWPRLAENRHPFWTASRLNENPDLSPTEASERFQKHLRLMIMRASALSVVRPREIDEIRNSAAHIRANSIRSNLTSSLAEWQALAEEYATENECLRTQNQGLSDEIDQLRIQLRNAEASAGGQPNRPAIELEPSPEATARPAKGTIRFYKKTGSTRKVDHMIRVKDCGHTSWQGAEKAEKAKKGIKRLEGSDDWSTIHHCGPCTGGGVYRVKW